MTTLSFERVDVLAGTVSDLSRSAQLSMSLANLANKKDIVEVAIAAKQDSFLQTVLALHYEGKMEKNFLLWFAHCLQHEAFIVFAEATILPSLLEVWRIDNAMKTQLSEQLSPVANDLFTHDLFTIAKIAHRLPTINQYELVVLFSSVHQREKQTLKGTHLLIPRMRLFMEFVQDLWFDYGIDLSIEHFLPFWLSLSEGRTAAIERVVYYLLRYNDAISSSSIRQILHILVLVTLSIKEMQTVLFKNYSKSNAFWLTSEELEKLLTCFVLDENFLLLTSKVNTMAYQEAKGQGRDKEYRNTIEIVLLHWVSSQYRTVLHRLVSKYHANDYYDFSFEQFVKYLPPFALLDCNSFAYQFDWSQNIRIAIPQLTQKEAHIFNNHPFVDFDANYEGRRYIDFYVWSAKVKNLGGNLNLTFALHNFRHNNFDDLAFWESVIRFCATNETVLEQYFQEHANTYSNLFGYLAHKRQEERNRFEMKGRTLRVIMQQAEEWYEQMNRYRYGNYSNPKLSWKGAAYQPYEWEQDKNVYTITQLTNNAALQAESNALHHCVAGYGQKCASGNCSIWSLRVSIDGSKAKSLVTLEIDNKHNIVQAKTVCNAQPNASHLDMIKKWAVRERIGFVRC